MLHPLSRKCLAETLTELVRTPSTNPGVYENEVAKKILSYFKSTSIEARLVESVPGRYSVGAILRGDAAGPRLILNGHMDTVPIDDIGLWTVEPFGAAVKDGFLYGRGACDMKAGLAIQIGVARYLATRITEMKGALVLHFAVGALP